MDDLKPGDWVAVVRDKTPGPFDDAGGQPAYKGAPCRVLAVSLPFVAALCRGRRLALDVRVLELQRVTPQYVRAMDEAGGCPVGRKRRPRPTPPDPRLCPRCGVRFVRRLVLTEVAKEWRIVCPVCNFEAGAEPCT